MSAFHLLLSKDPVLVFLIPNVLFFDMNQRVIGKALVRLVTLSYTCCQASTCVLSTRLSSWALTALTA